MTHLHMASQDFDDLILAEEQNFLQAEHDAIIAELKAKYTCKICGKVSNDFHTLDTNFLINDENVAQFDGQCYWLQCDLCHSLCHLHCSGQKTLEEVNKTVFICCTPN